MENSQDNKVVCDLRQSEEYGKYMETIGWETHELNEGSQIFIRKVGPIRVAKLQRTTPPFPWEAIEKVLKKEKIVMCKIEPSIGKTEEMICRGYNVSAEPLLGTKTLRVDLRPKEEEIFMSFKKDARYILRKFTIDNSQLTIDNYKKFYEIWKESAKRKKLWIPKEKDYFSLIECFKKNVFCVTSGDDAGALILIFKKTAFYYYAGGTSLGTRMNLPYFVVWTAMKEARERGCRLWDFEGIYDLRWPNKGWLGFSHFKHSFGGEEYEFPGSYTKWRWPL